MLVFKTIRREIAKRRLERLVTRQRASFEVRDYAKRRAAALKATRA